MIEITTEEAIKQLSRYDTEYYTPQTRAAHRMAIEALERSWRNPDSTLFDFQGVQPTIYGYSMKHLALVATMLRDKHITEEELVATFNDFEAMYNIVCQAHHLEIKQAINTVVYESVYPSAVDVAACLVTDRNWKKRPWDDLRDHSGLVTED